MIRNSLRSTTLQWPIYRLISKSRMRFPSFEKWNGASTCVPICVLVVICPMLTDPLISLVIGVSYCNGVSSGQCARLRFNGWEISTQLPIRRQPPLHFQTVYMFRPACFLLKFVHSHTHFQMNYTALLAQDGYRLAYGNQV